MRPQTTTTSRITRPTTTTSTGGLQTTTIYDPCEHLLQEIDESGGLHGGSGEIKDWSLHYLS